VDQITATPAGRQKIKAELRAVSGTTDAGVNEANKFGLRHFAS
jgi:hypothetical protein